MWGIDGGFPTGCSATKEVQVLNLLGQCRLLVAEVVCRCYAALVRLLCVLLRKNVLLLCENFCVEKLFCEEINFIQ